MKIDQEHVQYFADRYRKVQIRIIIVVFILIMVLGVAILATDAILAIFAFNADLIWLYCIMIIVGLLDIYLDIKFIKTGMNKTKYMKKREAAERYIRIHGYQFEDINNIPIPAKDNENQNK